MIWSLLKVTLFVTLIAAAAILAGYFADTGGGIRIAIAQQEFSLGPVQSVIALLVAVLALWLLLKVLSLAIAVVRFINGDETAISRYFDRNRERKGFQALTDGMLALASGDGKAALAHASRAERFLRRPELTNLVSAQAAEAAGDARKANEIYRRLVTDERTRFVGIRGLLKQKLAEGDRETALKLAERAFLMQPSNPDIQDVLFELQASAGDWTGARKVLGAKSKHGSLPRDVHRRRDAILALQEARAVFDNDLPVEAREAAIAANKQSPDLIPAAVLAAHAYKAADKTKYAVRILRKAWEAQPHPDLAAAFAALEPDETPHARLKRFEQLFAANPAHEETHLLKAELLVAAEDFPAARRALGDLCERHPTTRALTIMAAIERGEGAADSVVRGWLTRALSASRGPQWVCDKCQTVNSVWSPTCEKCGSFDTLSWREPPATGQAASPTDLLPLIVEPRARPTADTEAQAPAEPASTTGEADPHAVYDAEFFDAASIKKPAL
jgi:HemY protein